MKDEVVLNLAITPHFSLVIDKEDGTEPETWKLCLDYRALARIEEATGLDIKNKSVWNKSGTVGFSAKHFPAVVWGALQRFHPDVDIDRVLNLLNPEAEMAVTLSLFELCFPGLIEANISAMKDAEATGATDVGNVQTETTTV